MEIDEAEKMVVARLRRNGGRTKQHHDVGDSHVQAIRRFQPWMATFRDLRNDEREKTKEASHAWLDAAMAGLIMAPVATAGRSGSQAAMDEGGRESLEVKREKIFFFLI